MCVAGRNEDKTCHRPARRHILEALAMLEPLMVTMYTNVSLCDNCVARGRL